MTNNPTIDGVSRITIEPGCDFIEGFLIPTIKVKFPPCHVDDDESLDARDVAGEQIRALLDAPVVERQPDAYIVEAVDPNNGNIRRRGLHWHSTETLKETRDFKEWIGENITREQALYAAPPEVSALQSTIDQLQAENARIKARLCVCRDCGGQGEVYSGHSSYQGHNQPPEPDMDVCGTCDGDGVLGPLEDFEALASERDLLQARVAELESGRGEPVAHRLLRLNGFGEWVHDSVYWVDGKPCEDLISQVSRHPELYHLEYALAAPPVPVAVVPDGWKLVPVEPTAAMIEALARQEWPQDWEAGKRLQRLRGCGVVFPKSEIECAVGKYERMLAEVPACLDATAALNGERK